MVELTNQHFAGDTRDSSSSNQELCSDDVTFTYSKSEHYTPSPGPSLVNYFQSVKSPQDIIMGDRGHDDQAEDQQIISSQLSAQQVSAEMPAQSDPESCGSKNKDFEGESCVTQHFPRSTTLLEELSECSGFLTSLKSTSHVIMSHPLHHALPSNALPGNALHDALPGNALHDALPGNALHHVSGHGGDHLNTDNCTVELYHDLDKQPSVTSLLGSIDYDKEDYPRDLNSMSRDLDNASRDLDSVSRDIVTSQDPLESEDVPISSIWESRWLDHAAHLGRVMAQDKIQSESPSLQEQLLKNVSGDIPIESEKPKHNKGKRRRVVPEETKKKEKEKRAEFFTCKIPNCNAVFETQVKRWYHQQSVHKQVQLQCPDCSKVFITIQQLEVHLRSHYKIKPYKCTFEGCDKTFLTQQQCNNHALIHTGEKNFECSECHRKFREKNTLKRHTRTHSKVKAYICEICHKPFSYASTLNKHRKDRHADILETTRTPWIRTSMLPSDSFYRGATPENNSEPENQ